MVKPYKDQKTIFCMVILAKFLDMIYVNVYVLRHMKDLAWFIDKQLQVISYIMLFKMVIPLRNKLILLYVSKNQVLEMLCLKYHVYKTS